MALSNFQRHVDKISSGSASRGPSAVAERLVTSLNGGHTPVSASGYVVLGLRAWMLDRTVIIFVSASLCV